MASRKCSWPSARQEKKTFGISGNSHIQRWFGVIHFGDLHFGREIVTVHSHHEGPLVKQRIKVHPPHGELVVCSKKLHFWLWGWREQHLGRENSNISVGITKQLPQRQLSSCKPLNLIPLASGFLKLFKTIKSQPQIHLGFIC